jgi:hypothetical protein
MTARLQRLPQFVRRGDAERLHEMRHVEPVGAAGAGAFLAGEPDFFLWNGGELGETGERDGKRVGAIVGHKNTEGGAGASIAVSERPINRNYRAFSE